MEKEICEDCECEDSCLDDLKKNYLEIQVKYGLPNFDELNKDFQIEKIADSETDYLLREIRKYLVDKLTNYMNFVETILHPASGTMFIFSLIKTLGSDEKEILMEVYKKLAKNRVRVIGLDVEYLANKEADYIKDSFKLWQEMKGSLSKVLEVVEKNWDNKIELNGRKYLG